MTCDLESHYWRTARNNRVTDSTHVFSFSDLDIYLRHSIYAQGQRAHLEIARMTERAKREIDYMTLPHRSVLARGRTGKRFTFPDYPLFPEHVARFGPCG